MRDSGDMREAWIIDVVAIGLSTGGPNALAALLPELPADFPVPILIVQHMPRLFTGQLAARLAARCALEVREGHHGAAIGPGQAWIAPGDHHMTVVRGARAPRLRIFQGPPENSCRPAADPLFRSVARSFGARALAVVMTGMGQDGLRGCECIRRAGGQVVVQDEPSSVVWGMPGAVAAAGLAHKVLPLSQIGAELVRRAAGGRPHRSTGVEASR